MNCRKVSGFFLILCFLVFGPESVVHSETNYSIKQMTPAIEQAIKNRQLRFQELQGLKTKGEVGEDNQGFAKALKETAELNALVQAENKDREVIYQAVAEQNELGAQGLAKVKTVFGEVQRERAAAGEFVQLPDGQWVQK